MSDEDKAPPVLLTVKDWIKKHPFPKSEGSLRYMIHARKTNGFDTAFKKIGRRLLIDEAEFFACVARQN